MVIHLCFLDRKTTGDMVSAIMSDGSLIGELSGINILMLFLNLYQIIIIMFVFLHENIVLGVAECIVGFLYFISINLINKCMRASYTEFSKETANLNQTIVEDNNAVYKIKNLNEKRYFINKFNEQMWGKYFPAAKKVINIDVLSHSVNQFINLIFPMLIFVVGAADRVFIQGKSRDGKSTLLELICGFYDMPFGSIQINNCNVREMSEEQIFDWVKIQFQEPIIL